MVNPTTKSHLTLLTNTNLTPPTPPLCTDDTSIWQTEYTGDFNGQPNHKVVTWFWDTVRGFEHEQKAKLLQFVTGTSGVPVQGFGFLQGNDGNIRKFTLHGDKNVKVIGYWLCSFTLS